MGTVEERLALQPRSVTWPAVDTKQGVAASSPKPDEGPCVAATTFAGLAQGGGPQHLSSDSAQPRIGARLDVAHYQATEERGGREVLRVGGVKHHRRRARRPALREGPLLPFDQWTTVMLQNLPTAYTRDLLQRDLESWGVQFDFLYIPMNFRTNRARGYAFVNLLSHEDADSFKLRMNGFTNWSLPASEGCRASWGKPHLQGLTANIARFQNASLMHSTVPDSFRPAFFQLGVRSSFPASTRNLRPPRQGAERMRPRADGPRAQHMLLWRSGDHNTNACFLPIMSRWDEAELTRPPNESGGPSARASAESRAAHE